MDWSIVQADFRARRLRRHRGAADAAVVDLHAEDRGAGGHEPSIRVRPTGVDGDGARRRANAQRWPIGRLGRRASPRMPRGPTVFTVEAKLATELAKDAPTSAGRTCSTARSFTANRIEIRPRRGHACVREERRRREDEMWKNAAGQTVDPPRSKTC